MGNFISSMGRTINKDSMILGFSLEKDNVTNLTSLKDLTYTPTLCAGNYVVLPADQESIAGSDYAPQLERSRARTIKVLEETIATPK